MNRIIKIAFFLVLMIWCILIFAEFLIPMYNRIVFSLPILKKSFSLVCHQEPAKLITSGSFHSMVCARCAGIYLGALLASFLNIFPQFMPVISRKILIFSSIPMIIDVIGTSLSIYNYSKISAFLTGFLFGMVTFLYFYSAFTDLITEIKDKK